MLILTYPDVALSTPAVDGTPGPETAKLLADMEETMDLEGGIGLAANQVGVLVRAVVIKTDAHGCLHMLNPRITAASGIKVPTDERCLSVPGLTRRRHRANSVTVRYQLPYDGDFVTVKLKGVEAICFAHELDHINGRTIADA